MPITLKHVKPETGVTVVFQVLLVSNFKMEEECLRIRANAEDLGSFRLNCVDMELIGLVCLIKNYTGINAFESIDYPARPGVFCPRFSAINL